MAKQTFHSSEVIARVDPMIGEFVIGLGDATHTLMLYEEEAFAWERHEPGWNKDGKALYVMWDTDANACRNGVTRITLGDVSLRLGFAPDAGMHCTGDEAKEPLLTELEATFTLKKATLQKLYAGLQRVAGAHCAVYYEGSLLQS